MPRWFSQSIFLLLEDPRLVLLGVDLHFEIVRRRARAGARDDLHRLAGGQLRVHAGGRDADALLAAAHAQPVKLRAVEQLREDPRDLLAHDAGAVVDHGDAEAVRLARRRRVAAVGCDFDLDDDLGQNARLLAGVERIVDGFLDAGEERLARIVEAQQMAVLGEELRDRDLALARAHLGCRYGRLRRGSLGVDRRRIGLWHGFRHCFFHISTGIRFGTDWSSGARKLWAVKKRMGQYSNT